MLVEVLAESRLTHSDWHKLRFTPLIAINLVHSSVLLPLSSLP